MVNVVLNGTAISITTLLSGGGGCSYSGTLTQYGQMGQIDGSFACSDGSQGSFIAAELQVTEISINGRFNAAYTVAAGCQASG
jgi:hypothetical protein